MLRFCDRSLAVLNDRCPVHVVENRVNEGWHLEGKPVRRQGRLKAPTQSHIDCSYELALRPIPEPIRTPFLCRIFGQVLVAEGTLMLWTLPILTMRRLAMRTHWRCSSPCR